MKNSKKTTIIGKRQILMVTMVLALGAAVWLNVKYATGGTDFSSVSSISDAKLGDAKYVANTSVVTSSDNNDEYFTKACKERDAKRQNEIDILNDTLNSVKNNDEAKTNAAKQISVITDRMDKESSVETLIKAKGFKNVIAVISDKSCSIVVKNPKELSQSQMVQILDIVNSVTEINLENIKIVSVK